MILLFTKSPEFGKVKTRLQSHIGARSCLQLQCFLIRKLIAEIEASKLPYQLWLEGDPEALNIALPEIGASIDAPVQRQSGEDLGSKMVDAISKTLSRSDRVLIVGSDCLEISAGDLVEAWHQLDRSPVVIKPALDGGYVLFGCRKVYPELFEGIEWGSDRVLRQTLDKLDKYSKHYRLLPAGRDLDTLDDLIHFSEIHSEISQYIEIKG